MLDVPFPPDGAAVASGLFSERSPHKEKLRTPSTAEHCTLLFVRYVLWPAPSAQRSGYCCGVFVLDTNLTSLMAVFRSKKASIAADIRSHAELKIQWYHPLPSIV
ncbi:hypothetical protein PHLGIDRAFT_461626 [Phlebiopsis gigantea 11061_1 CR5-6]|uniref:Uncharacterized protein n=1 Tax=Phlebiopsis gigantea (strain 11061_1 CR5-6) TaxID=745531 RepID=A0A0C3NMW2_PHLG1|nr:hypothetical protein PHLGIDRAFT_461626 [Phlebiopsis gigantea 11061_1 CR5-6]